MHRTRLSNMRAFVGWLADNGPLRADLAEDDAAAAVWTLTSPDVHRLLVDEVGWEAEHYREWLHRTLEAVLLPPDAT
jgi:hypothetical protein